MNSIKNLIYISIFILIASCESEPTFPPPGVDHYKLDKVLDHMPFDQFNEYSKAIFRDANGKQIAFTLTIDEDVFDFFTDEGIYSTNRITFGYINDFDFEIPELEVIAKIDSLPTLGLTEHLICTTSSLFISSFSGFIPKLTILPGQSYQNTILNEEFTWMEETFQNVYSNVLIEETNPSNVKIFYQSSIGIVGFTDNSNKSWVFERFE
jgi:hypothetical protein